MERRAGREGAGGGGRRPGGGGGGGTDGEGDGRLSRSLFQENCTGSNLSLRPGVAYAVGGALKASDLRNVSRGHPPSKTLPSSGAV